ncbi:MAG: nucleotidyltransferase domain-containing protein [Firmicutes bacterium]|nr:nucleotidyltransferase domain-containing protein [Bacillota bacterium]
MYGVTCCYLFGSRAGGDFYPDSDVDLAVIFRHFNAEVHTLALEIQMQEDLVEVLDPAAVDLVFLQRVPVHLRFHAIRTAKVIYCEDDDFRTDFEDITVRDYLDFKPVVDRYYLEVEAEILGRSESTSGGKGDERA